MEAEHVYNIVMGYCIPENGIDGIDNLFADGAICDCLYAEVYEAKLRINQRLGTQEDEDVELIIANLLRISRKVGLKMLEYGMQQQEKK